MGEWKNYFVYTKRERQAVILLLVLVISLLAIPHLFEPPLVPVSGGLKEPFVIVEAKEVPTITESSSTPGSPERLKYKPGKLSVFNPNTAGLKELMNLGISEKAANVIIHYREKGGKFRKVEDLSRIYSIRKDLYEQLRPYVRIPEESKEHINYRKRDSMTYATGYRKNVRSPISIEINKADQADWESLPGIGAKLAMRIITFREKLGGFIKPEQVKETYGITDSVFAVIRPMLQCNNPSIRQFDLNSITVDELKEHPYFRGKIAYSIIGYREQHGKFKSMDDLKKLQGIDDVVRSRIEPYLVIKNS